MKIRGVAMTGITDEKGYNKLISIIEEAPSREWADKYLDWMKKPLDAHGIHTSRDDRFAMTFSTGSYTGLNLLGNNPRCIKIMPSDGSVDVLLPRKFELLEEETLNDPNNDRSYGNRTSELPDGKYYWLNAPVDGFVLDEFEDEWLSAVDVELSGKSKSRNSHEHVIYRAVVDNDDREIVLDEAF